MNDTKRTGAGTWKSKRFVTDENVEKLGISIFDQLNDQKVAIVFHQSLLDSRSTANYLTRRLNYWGALAEYPVKKVRKGIL